jgi:hypothetical protein
METVSQMLTHKPRNRPHSLHLLLRSLPPLAPRNRRRLHNLRQQLGRQRSGLDVPVSAGQSHPHGRVLFVCGPKHVVVRGDFLRGARDKATHARGAGCCFQRLDEEACGLPD